MSETEVKIIGLRALGEVGCMHLDCPRSTNCRWVKSDVVIATGKPGTEAGLITKAKAWAQETELPCVEEGNVLNGGSVSVYHYFNGAIEEILQK